VIPHDAEPRVLLELNLCQPDGTHHHSWWVGDAGRSFMNVRPQHSVAEALYAELLHSCTERTRMEFKNLRRTLRPVDYSHGVP
jgi:hypothetical protein